MRLFKKKEKEIKKEQPDQKPEKNVFDSVSINHKYHEEVIKKSIQVESYKQDSVNFAQDSRSYSISARQSISRNNIPINLLDWYSSQGFIGFQACAIIAQNWLVNKACSIPARDATRNGYEITINSDKEIPIEIIDEIKNLDKQYHINEILYNQIYFGRIFGIRIAMFKVRSRDENYYEKPFNIDGITEGSYHGIVQIDPSRVSPILDQKSSSEVSGIDPQDHRKTYFEPTWWLIDGEKIHRSHLCIYRGEEVADILKPTYLYAGLSIPQKIYEKVYNADRTSNEAPLLAMTKRQMVYKTDISQALMNQGALEEKLQKASYLQDNYGTRVIDIEDSIEQVDTSLSDLDNLIMTEYQIVAAACNVPATKLLGTPPKGFNSTGEYEESSYHEELESIQCHYLLPILNKHHQILIKSEIMKKYSVEMFDTLASFDSLDAMTAIEKASLNKIKAETALINFQVGAITGDDERNRIMSDEESGYNGIGELDEFDDFESDREDVELYKELLKKKENGRID